MKVNNNINEIKDYSLSNLENYNKTIQYTAHEIIEKYILLINEFLKFILEKTKLKENNYSKFIIIRGYDTITNVFNIIFLYTKNLDLTFYHCQKGYYYYIEFIEQISNIDHIFLQLNSKDASTYVYKKTIFELNNDKDKDKGAQTLPINIKNILENVEQHIKTFKNIFEFIVESLITDNKPFINTEIVEKFKIICQKIFTKNNIKNIHIKKIYNEIEIANIEFLNNINKDENVINNDNIIQKYFDHIILQLK
jgi:hypothetical protein